MENRNVKSSQDAAAEVAANVCREAARFEKANSGSQSIYDDAQFRRRHFTASFRAVTERSTLETRRRREANASRQFDVGDSPVGLQNPEDFQIYRVELHMPHERLPE